MKKFIFLILPAVMLMLASCMDSAGGNGGAGSVRVALPGSSRDVSSSANADSYTVSLLKGGKVIESQTAVPGGAVEFDELDAGDYTVDVEATLSGALSGFGSADVAVTEGETASCSVLMQKVDAVSVVEYIKKLDAGSYKVIVAGAITEDELSNIAENLNKVPSGGRISLDLGRTTGLTKIETSKFKDCTALSAIVLPEGISSIYDNAFNGCASLASVTIPDTVTAIGTSAFKECTALTSITIPNGVLAITTSAFEGCSALKSVVIPDSVATIGDKAFYKCKALESIEIPDIVTSIGQYAFYGCSALKSIEIPDTVTSIGNYAFINCTALESATLPKGISTLPNEVFYGCKKLKSITIPDNVTSLTSSVFQNCTSLESVEILGNVSTITRLAFGNCSALKSITIPSTVTKISGGAFDGCNNPLTVNYKGTKSNWENIDIVEAEYGCYNPPFESDSGTKIICTDGTITL